MHVGLLASLAFLTFSLAAGDKPLTKTEQAARFHPVAATPSPDAREGAFAQRNKLLAESTLKAIPFRSVGPLGQGGRVVGKNVTAKDAKGRERTRKKHCTTILQLLVFPRRFQPRDPRKPLKR